VSLAPYVHLAASLDEAGAEAGAGAGAGTEVTLDADAAHHLGRVLRLGPGADLVVSDGAGGEAPAELGDGTVRLTAPITRHPAPTPHVTVAQGLPKARKLDEVLRQLTELGVDRLVPVAATRSVVRLDADRADRALTRWRAIARAAAEQARRPWLPEVAPVTSASSFAAAGSDADLLVAHVGATRSLPAALADRPDPARPIVVAVGPEGGWDDAEVAAFVGAGGEVVGLGPTVLRTEHAAAAAVAVVAAATGRWDRDR
jgi:16S rRNA (uracil1498-N3)-methyltransferase